jgi:hypothetical protein
MMDTLHNLRHLNARYEHMLERLGRDTFRYFELFQEPTTGLIYDRSALYSPASVAATGFALTSYCIAAERNWVSRDQAAMYCHRVLSTLLDAPTGPELEGTCGVHGMFHHFLDPKTATRACNLKFWPQILHWFTEKKPERIDIEVSIIDTTLLIAGALSAKNYFQGASPRERSIRDLVDKLYKRVEWDWLLGDDGLLRMGWKPETGILEARFSGVTEAFLLYILAIGAPKKHAIPATSWAKQLAGVRAETLYGQTFARSGDFPIFLFQFPLCWINFQGIQDNLNRSLGFDWFENAQRAVRAHHNYAIANPLGYRGYGPHVWGLNACGGPGDATIDGIIYHAYGVRTPGGTDDGTINPGACAASLPLAPKLVLSTLDNWRQERPELFTETGLTDAFNPNFDRTKPSGWVDGEQIGITQGSILPMLENYRTGLPWKLMMNDSNVRDGLCRAGFTGGWLAGS